MKTAYDAAGIEIPEPIYRVHLREGGPASGGSPEGKVEIPIPGTATVEEDLSADHTIDEQIEEDAIRSGERNLLPSAPDSFQSHE